MQGIRLLLAVLLATDADLRQARQALEAGRASEAKTILEQALAQAPANLDAWALLARTYSALKDPAKASLSAKRADRPTASPEALHTLALYYAQNGNRKRAAELEGKFALSPVADDSAAARAALLNYEVGDLAAAIRFGELAERKQQPRSEVTLMLARAYEAGRETDKSLERYEQWLGRSGGGEEAHSQVGQAYLRAGRFAKAVPFLEESAAKYPDSAQMQLALGVAYYGQRRFEDAGLRFIRTIDIDPSVVQPYVFLAKMVDQLEPLWSTIEPQFRKWYEKDSSGHLAPFVWAKLLLARGGADQQAEALLRESIARKPDYWEPHFELGGLLEKKRQWAEAAAAYETSARFNAKQAEPQYRLARVYSRLNQPAKAAQARAKHQQLSTGAPASGMADRR